MTEWPGFEDCRCYEAGALCAFCAFTLKLREIALEERLAKMTPEEWTQVLVWAMDFESRAIRIPEDQLPDGWGEQ